MKGVIYLQNHVLVFFIILCFSFVTHSLTNTSSSSSSSTITCLPHQSSALLHLKQEFALKNLSFTYQFGLYGPLFVISSPKMKLWKAGTDCCEWDGVACDMKTGQVVMLDLSCSGLQGPLLSNSSLFDLRQLRQLNLALNNFTFTQIPSTFGRLSRLTHLNLSHAVFSGRIPSEIAWLTDLVSLDLSSYMVGFPEGEPRGILSMRMTKLTPNMTNLRELYLSGVNLSSSYPQFLTNLSSLTSLSLSRCNLHGEFPKDIFQLPNIKFIDVSLNFDLTGTLPEFASGSNLQSLILSETKFSDTLPDSIGNLKSLGILDLFYCNFSGTIPSSMGNLSQLTTLYLTRNNFHGQLPSTLGYLSQLTTLHFSKNNFIGQLPSTLGNLSQLTTLIFSENNFIDLLPSTLGNLSQLTTLVFSENNFIGQLPSTLGNLSQLTYLVFSENNFIGQLPSTLGNLSQLIVLVFFENNFIGQLPSTLGNLYQLKTLSFYENNFIGQLPSTLGNLSQLNTLYFLGNNFIGQLPSTLGNLSQLTALVSSENNFNGQIPSSILNLKSLVRLYLASNNFSGTLELDMTFPKQSKVRYLDLSNNRHLSIKVTGTSSTLPKFSSLSLSSCNIGKKFPDFLRTQDELGELDLSNNKIEGEIPSWFFKIGIDTLYRLNLSHNSLSSWEKDPKIILPWKSLRFLDLRSNMLQGSLVVPPLSTEYFFVSENKLTGGIHPLFCNLRNLTVLDLSNNLLNGTIPQCLGSFSNSLLVLSMKGNNFHGTIPQTFLNGSSLQTLDLSHNELQGKLPQSLIHCRALEVLNLGHNKINDVFPLWLQNLPELQVLVLRSNEFHGLIWHPDQKLLGFPKLRILDLSFNKFNGNLSREFFSNWSAINADIRASNKSELRYMGDIRGYYQDSVTIMNKGSEMVLVKILTVFTSIDLSNNDFHGEIPTSMGDLKSLIVLNLSSNNFEGLIPSSLGKLTELESLDLSNNSFSGRIPQELASLSFLEYLNLSDNKLRGPIPQSRQFDTFLNSSFEGNLGLCGSPLSKKCQGTNETPTPDPCPESTSENGFGWKAVVVGYGCGFLVGAIGGHLLFWKKPTWFIRIYGRKMQR